MIRDPTDCSNLHRLEQLQGKVRWTIPSMQHYLLRCTTYNPSYSNAQSLVCHCQSYVKFFLGNSIPFHVLLMDLVR